MSGEPLARAHEQVRVFARHEREAVGARDLRERLPERIDEVQAGRPADVVDQVDEHLGVGLAPKLVALGDEALLVGGVVLDDAVVDERKSSAGRHVRVRILIGREAVRGPARVADAERAFERLVFEGVFEPFHLADLLAHGEPAVHHGDADRVVAAVFEALEARENNGFSLLMADITDDTTHERAGMAFREK